MSIHVEIETMKSSVGHPGFSADELVRYSRQLSLPGFGMEGQHRLASARVLVVGAGGLGSPVLLYLAAAGVGTIGIVEFDSVDESNLHRQILYTSRDAGRPKIHVASERIIAANPNVSVRSFDERLTSVNALEIMQDFDLVIDGSDNFPTRYLVNDAAVLLGIPSIYGSIHRFEGQVSVFGAGNGPCYRCLFREPPPAGAIPNCAEAGVLGVLPGIIGTLQATEAIKLIAGIGDPLIGRLVLFDALAMTFRTIELRRDPECPSCGISRSDTLVDYDLACQANGQEEAGAGVQIKSTDSERPDPARAGGIASITPLELAERLERSDDIDLVDVREGYEWQIARIAGARLVPLGQILDDLDTFDPARETVLYCKTGVRSLHAARQLASAGIPRVVNLEGGIMRWREDVDQSIPVY
jgi:molybdopterin/thiamine biosynthesis adenylyltransferase/rhodanese-related sulfurtransferase